MKREIILGQIRELLTIIGALCFAMFAADTWQSITGGIVALIAIIFALAKHDGIESIFTLVRKFLSLVPAILVHFNVIDSLTAGKMITGLAPLFALAWSYLVNSGKVKGSIPPIPPSVLGLIPLCLSLMSCGYLDASIDTRGAVPTAPDGDGDGIPDRLTVPSDQVTPVINQEAVNDLIEKGVEGAINYAK